MAVVSQLAVVQVAFENDEVGFGEVEEEIRRFVLQVPDYPRLSSVTSPQSTGPDDVQV